MNNEETIESLMNRTFHPPSGLSSWKNQKMNGNQLRLEGNVRIQLIYSHSGFTAVQFRLFTKWRIQIDIDFQQKWNRVVLWLLIES